MAPHGRIRALSGRNRRDHGGNGAPNRTQLPALTRHSNQKKTEDGKKSLEKHVEGKLQNSSDSSWRRSCATDREPDCVSARLRLPRPRSLSQRRRSTRAKPLHHPHCPGSNQDPHRALMEGTPASISRVMHPAVRRIRTRTASTDMHGTGARGPLSGSSPLPSPQLFALRDTRFLLCSGERGGTEWVPRRFVSDGKLQLEMGLQSIVSATPPVSQSK